LNAVVRNSNLGKNVIGYRSEETVQNIVSKYENAKALYDMLVAFRMIVTKPEVTDDKVAKKLAGLVTSFITVSEKFDANLSSDVSHGLTVVRGNWLEKMKEQEKEASQNTSTPSTPSPSMRK
jgi:hypothetical protein